MPEYNPSRRRRPVDALFGDSGAPSSMDYVVEPPQPTTTVSPPPPDALAPRPPVPAPAPAAAPSPAPPALIPPAAPTPIPQAEPALTPASQEPVAPPSSAPAPPPVVPATPVRETVSSIPARVEAATPVRPPLVPAALAPQRSRPLATFDTDASIAPAPPTPPDRIEKLYELVKFQAADSSIVADECMDLLLRAREAADRQDSAGAEYFAQTVEARLRQSAISRQAAHKPGVMLLWLWLLASLTLDLLTLGFSYVLDLTFFGLAVAPAAIVLLRALIWASLGGVLGALSNLSWAVRRREYDTEYAMGYFARPIVGAILGGVLFVLSQAGIVAGNVAVGDTQVGPLFLYVFAALIGFGQDAVTGALRGAVRAVSRSSKDGQV
ncbi:MAG: hypothetical protein M1482_11025 [Chloroflexi bacterium]|nr:hypothetical protein [Chloroflexota bacterium]